MLGKTIYSFQNLEGETRGHILVGTIASLHPVRWNVECQRCHMSTVLDHMALQGRYEIPCPNSSCGRMASAPQSTVAQSTGQRVPAIRSRDIDSSREFERRQTRPAQKITWGQISDAAMQDASPDSLRRYLDWRDECR